MSHSPIDYTSTSATKGLSYKPSKLRTYPKAFLFPSQLSVRPGDSKHHNVIKSPTRSRTETAIASE